MVLSAFSVLNTLLLISEKEMVSSIRLEDTMRHSGHDWGYEIILKLVNMS